RLLGGVPAGGPALAGDQALLAVLGEALVGGDDPPDPAVLLVAQPRAHRVGVLAGGEAVVLGVIVVGGGPRVGILLTHPLVDRLSGGLLGRGQPVRGHALEPLRDAVPAVQRVPVAVEGVLGRELVLVVDAVDAELVADALSIAGDHGSPLLQKVLSW